MKRKQVSIGRSETALKPLKRRSRPVRGTDNEEVRVKRRSGNEGCAQPPIIK
jgi:hypothetical protein